MFTAEEALNISLNQWKEDKVFTSYLANIQYYIELATLNRQFKVTFKPDTFSTMFFEDTLTEMGVAIVKYLECVCGYEVKLNHYTHKHTLSISLKDWSIHW